MLEPELRREKMTGKGECLSNSRLHQWTPSKSPKPDIESSQRAVPSMLSFCLSAALSVHVNLLSLLHVLFLFVMC